MSTLDPRERRDLVEKFIKEEEKALSGIDSTSFLFAQLERFRDAGFSKHTSGTVAPKTIPILRAEIDIEELSANHVPTSLPLNRTDSSLPAVQDYFEVARTAPHLLSSKIRVGIPSVLRGVMWKTMSQSDSTNLEKVYYQFLKEEEFEYEKIILRDVPRTFPRLPMFSEVFGPGQVRLFNLMKAYSLYDSEVGYCQGLGFMAGPLIMNLPEVDAFCVFVRLMETYGMRTMFTVRMDGLRLRLIYDVVFAEGAPETIMRVALALLKKNEAYLLSLRDGDVSKTFLDKLAEAYSKEADSGAFCYQKPSIPPKSPGWLKTIVSRLYPDNVSNLRSSSQPEVAYSSHSAARDVFFKDLENHSRPHRLKPISSPLQTADMETEGLKKDVYDLQQTAESHVTALTQLRQDHLQLKIEMMHVKNENYTLYEEKDHLKHELNKLKEEYIDFQKQSKDALLRQQAHIQEVEKQLLHTKLHLKGLQDERDDLLRNVNNSKDTQNLGEVSAKNAFNNGT
ncbi:hypothetical protein L0F63_004512 [Massospora cicadina]|nr:hypothetical protein L0F63_004512 [Massospora cicadina]